MLRKIVEYAISLVAAVVFLAIIAGLALLFEFAASHVHISDGVWVAIFCLWAALVPTSLVVIAHDVIFGNGRWW